MFVELNDNYNYIDENGELKNSTMTYYDFNPLYDNEDDKDKTGSTIIEVLLIIFKALKIQISN